jgi:hypothetical protein
MTLSCSARGLLVFFGEGVHGRPSGSGQTEVLLP